ncbi:hypothetical protein, partial [Ramlibacter sp.]|uniref:hypothetical protein n=1 Tax=Ramlibacter sp. TaxID=1917967 RepID=UPI003D146BD7
MEAGAAFAALACGVSPPPPQPATNNDTATQAASFFIFGGPSCLFLLLVRRDPSKSIAQNKTRLAAGLFFGGATG